MKLLENIQKAELQVRDAIIAEDEAAKDAAVLLYYQEMEAALETLIDTVSYVRKLQKADASEITVFKMRELESDLDELIGL